MVYSKLNSETKSEVQKAFADLDNLTKKSWYRTVHMDIPKTGYELKIYDGEWHASAY